MLGRIASLRLRLLGAMLATAVVGLAGAYFATGRILAEGEQSSDRRQALSTAAMIATRVHAGADLEFLRTAQSVLRSEQIVVSRHGRVIFAGPALTNEPLETTVTRSFPGARVVVRKYELTAPTSDSLELTLVAAGVSGLVILTVLVITVLLTRTVRGPIERAITAADRVAAGDLSARIGGGGPDEFDRLSHAFDEMAERLEASDAEQRRFLADIAHEIATPINAMSNLAGALADGTAATDADRAETTTLLAEETTRVKALLEDLRQLTKLDLTQEADPLTTTSNQRVLETVLTNLLTNAIRYTRPRNRRLRARTRDRPPRRTRPRRNDRARQRARRREHLHPRAPQPIHTPTTNATTRPDERVPSAPIQQ